MLAAIVAAVSALLVACVRAQSIDLRAGKEFEVFADLKQGETWGVQFQLTDGLVAFRLASPEGVVHEGAAESYGSYTLAAKSAGVHSFRFSNREGGNAPARKVSFRILGDAVVAAAGGTREASAGRVEKLDPLMRQLRDLNNALRTASDEHAFLMDREVQHRLVALSTKSRVLWWFFSQIVIISAVCYFQITSLKRFFEVRRLV